MLETIRHDLKSGNLTSTGLVENAYSRIQDAKGEGPKSFIRLFRLQAEGAARAADALYAANVPPQPLLGLPIAVKDAFDFEGSVTSAGSKVLLGNQPALRDATAVLRLRAAGAVILGTTNMTEFAMGGVGINPHFGTPLNPYDRGTGRIPGGSSSGSAIAVADGIVPAAIGTDTAGSIQMPAALCGIVGFKPTAKRVPLDGVVPLAPSLDSVGPLAISVACCATVDSVLAGESAEALEAVSVANLVFGVPQALVLDDLEPAVARAFALAISRLSEAGARIVDVPFPELRDFPQIGFAVVEGFAWHRKYLAEHRALYDPIIASRFELGASICAADYIDLLNLRKSLIRRGAITTKGFDAMLMPTVPIVAPLLADFESNEQMWLATNRKLIRNPSVANILDRCALSIPCHPVGEAPVGISVMGEHGADRRILAIGHAIQKLLDPRFAHAQR